MLENKGTRLLAMALRTGLILPRHRQATGRFENIFAMRIVALNTIHPAFDHRMMLRQVELGVNLQVTFGNMPLGLCAG